MSSVLGEAESLSLNMVDSGIFISQSHRCTLSDVPSDWIVIRCGRYSRRLNNGGQSANKC